MWINNISQLNPPVQKISKKFGTIEGNFPGNYIEKIKFRWLQKINNIL